MTRARRILELLIDAGDPLSMDQIVRGVDEGTIERSKLYARVAAQLCIFVGDKRVTRIGRMRGARYTATVAALVDRRVKAAPSPSGVRKRRKADREAQEPSAARASKVPRQPPHTKLVLVGPAEARSGAPKLSTREQLDADVAAFLAKGGQIQRLCPGESATPTHAWLVANGRAKPRKSIKHRTTPETDDDTVAA